MWFIISCIAKGMHACVYKLHEFWRKRLYLLGIFCLVSVIKFQDVIKMQPHFDKINFLMNFKAICISLSSSSFSVTFEPKIKRQNWKQWNTFNYSSIMRITPRDFSARASPESSLSSQCESFEIRSPFVSNSSAVWECDII